MMPVARLGKTELRLQQPMDRGRGKQIAPAHDVGYALQRVVDHDRQMIAWRQISAAEDNVPPNLRRRRTPRGDSALAIFGPAKTRWRGVGRALHVEAERGLFAAGDAIASLRRGERAASSRIERCPVRVASAAGSALDLRTAAKAGVDEALLIEARERRHIIVAVLALPARRRRKAKPEPSEVVDNAGDELRLATRTVQIFDAQQHASIDFPGDALIEEGRIGVAQMKRAIRRRRKAQNGRGR